MSAAGGQDARLVADTIRTLQKHLQCVICFETLRDPMTTRCGHTFCQVCINRVVKGKNSLCPLCNTRMNRRGIVENDKIRSVVKAVHTIICNAQKDITDMGYEDLLQILKENTPTATRKSLSPIKHVNSRKLPSTSAVEKSVSRRSNKVESWLMDVHVPSPSQASIQSLQPAVVNGDSDSDSEMASVSQINPDETSKRKPLSAYIEEDCEPQNSVKKPVLQKNKKSNKMGPLNVKAKQESLKGFGPLKVTPTKADPKTLKGMGNIQMTIPDPVIVVIGPDKENTINDLSTNSPGWSRFQKMKKDFHVSPAPIIEDPGSCDETPCLNLSLDSPVLKKKDRVNEIVNSLQSEIEIFEKSALPINKSSESSLPVKTHLVESSSVLLQPQGVSKLPPSLGLSNHRVKFFKLGQLVKKESRGVPFYLRGSLESLQFAEGAKTYPRLLLDAQTQTDFDIVGSHEQEANKSINEHGDSHGSFHVLSSPVARRSLGAQSEVDMDAETVLFTQPIMNGNCRTVSPLPLPNEGPTTLDTEIIECTYPQNNLQTQKSDAVVIPQDSLLQFEKTCGAVHEDKKESQYPELIPSSLDIIGGTPVKIIDLNTASNDTLQVDLNEDSCSSVGPDRRSKRSRKLGSFSDSSDSDVGVSINQKRRRKNKIRELSDNENSCSFYNDDDPDIGVVDTSKIMANIEAQLAEEEGMQTVEWLKTVTEKNTEPLSEPLEECVDVLSNTSRKEIDSDGDSEVINPTPQKQSSFSLRQTTQSDDIVPSSQPPVPIIPIHRSPLSFLENNHKDSTGNKSNDVQSNDLFEPGGQQKSICKDLPERSLLSLTVGASEPIRSSNAEEATCVENPNKRPKLQFVCSSLPASSAAQVEKLAKIVQAEFSPKFTTDTSHLIVRVDENKKADKTLKYLCAVAAGKWVVSFAWVEKSLEAGKLLPEEPFEALDATGEPGPRRSREAQLSNKKLFGGFEFCCIGDFPDISKAQMQALLVDCGASMVREPTDFSFQDHIIPVALAQWDEAQESQYSVWLDTYSTPLVQHEWVLDCIGKFAVTSFSAMLLCDVSEDYLASMGIPSYLFELTESEQ